MGLPPDFVYEENIKLHARIARLRMFLEEIAAMGPADEEGDADTLENAIALAKRGLEVDG